MWLVKHSVNMAEMRAFSISNTKKGYIETDQGRCRAVNLISLPELALWIATNARRIKNLFAAILR